MMKKLGPIAKYALSASHCFSPTRVRLEALGAIICITWISLAPGVCTCTVCTESSVRIIVLRTYASIYILNAS
jgi:hypothetical protein